MAGSRPKTFWAGAQLTWKWQRLIWWVFGVCLVLAFFAAHGSVDRLAEGINHSVAAQRLVNGFDISALVELSSVPDAPLQTMSGGGVYFSFIFTIFLLLSTGGIIATYIRDERPETSNFFEACGYHFWRFFRLMLYMLVALIPIGILAGIAGAMYNSIDEKSISPMPAVHVIEVAAVVILFLLMVVRLWFDMAQVIAVFEDEKRMHKALRLAAVLVAKNFFSLFWLYFRITFIGWLLFFAGLHVWMMTLAPTSIVAGFVVSQLMLLFWIGTRLWQRASESLWYREYRAGLEVAQPVWTPAPVAPPVPVIEPLVVPPVEPATS
jgi:hypothetical protein